MTVDFTKPADEKYVYPAVHHFRVITDAEVATEAAITEALGAYEVVSPLARGRSSSGGRYLVFEVSVRLSSRAEHFAVDAAIKGVEGVRILL